jgi:inhibitor of cysteine peptidase
MGGKMRIFMIITICLGVLIFASACNASQDVKIGGESDGGEVQLKTGQALAVTLESNPTTGYSWQVAQTDEALLKPEGDPFYQPDNHDNNVVGAGGKETLRFTAVAPGQVILKLAYQRPWEEGVEPAQTFTVTVNIQ